MNDTRIAFAIFNKPFSELTSAEMVIFKQYTRKLSYYRQYEKNRDKLREWKQDKKRKVLTALGWEPKCVECGYDRYLGALDFHHVDRSQKDDVVLALPTDKAIEEARKCQLLCACCHREAHANDEPHQRNGRGRPRKYDPMLETVMRAAGLSEDVITNAMAGRPAE